MFWEWVGYEEMPDLRYQIDVMDPELNAFVHVMEPVLRALLSDASGREKSRCRAALDDVIQRGRVRTECITTPYFLRAMYITGLAGHYEPPLDAGRSAAAPPWWEP